MATVGNSTIPLSSCSGGQPLCRSRQNCGVCRISLLSGLIETTITSVDPEEVSIAPGPVHTATLSDGLEFVTDAAASYKPVSFTSDGAPLYDLNRHDVLSSGTQKPASSGGGQVLATHGPWTVLTTGAKPFAPESLAGAENGVAKWAYPSLWPGLHASHNAPSPDHPGELIGTTRLLGPSFQLKNAKDIELWAVNGNKGTIYLFTSDGLFVTTLFQDSRLPSASWSKHSHAVRGMSVSDLTTGEENFWPSITQTSDGHVYVVTNFPAIIRVEGLDTLQRIPPQTINLTPQNTRTGKKLLWLEGTRSTGNKTSNRGLDGTCQRHSREARWKFLYMGPQTVRRDR